MGGAGHLEQEIRTLPSVLACAVADDHVTVLIAPDGDPDMVAAAVTAILTTLDVERPVAVLGGTPSPAPVAGRRRFPVAAALSAAAALAAVTVVGSLVIDTELARAPGDRATTGDDALAPRPPAAPPVLPGVERAAGGAVKLVVPRRVELVTTQVVLPDGWSPFAGISRQISPAAATGPVLPAAPTPPLAGPLTPLPALSLTTVRESTHCVGGRKIGHATKGVDHHGLGLGHGGFGDGDGCGKAH